MFKKFTEGFQSTLAQAGEQAKARNGIIGGASPRPSTTVDRVSANVPPPIHVPYNEENMDSDDEGKEAPGEITETEGQVSANGNTGPSASSVDPELPKRLNKLAKYEKKYPELLKAYRALQAQDISVKAFEKVLGETTTATSVLDIEAFQQWANNLTMKADMAMDELRKISQEQDALRAQCKVIALEHDSSIAQYQQRITELEDERSKAADSSTRMNGAAEPSSTVVEQYEEQIRALQSDNQALRTSVHTFEAQISQGHSSMQEVEERLAIAEHQIVKEKQTAEQEYEELVQGRDTLRRELTELKIKHAQEINQIRSMDHGADVVRTDGLDGAEEGKSVIESQETPLTKNQKKRKNKKKSAAKLSEMLEMPTKETEMVEPQVYEQPDVAGASRLQQLVSERDALQLELATLRAQSDSFAEERATFVRKLTKSQEHRESIDDLRDMLRDVGNNLVEARDQVKALNLEKATLVTQIQALKTELDAGVRANNALRAQVDLLESAVAEAPREGDKEASEGMEKAQNELREQLSASEDKLKSVAKDLEIAEKLSTERFKELSTVKDTLRLQTSELNELKRGSQRMTTEKTTLEGSLKSAEARSKALERAEKDRRDELEKSQRNLASREKELKVIQTAFKEEEVRRKSEETRAATLKGEVTKLTTLRDSIISSRNELTTQIASMRSELDSANTKIVSLQQLRNKMTQERDAAQEELQLGRAKFDSSYSLMESQREQTTDMQHRLRETTERHEAMEEELSEAQRQLTERARESETLRRLLSEIEGSQESRLREMRDRMEVAIAERDKAEDEAAFTGKKRAREVEDLKEKLMDVERAQRKLTTENKDLSVVTEGLKRAAEASKTNIEAKDRDLEDIKSTMNELSTSLREAESQITSLEHDRDALRGALKESSSRLDRLNMEISTKDDLINKLRNERAHMLDRADSPLSPSPGRKYSQRSSSITSIPASPAVRRSPSMQSVTLNDRPIEKAEVDREYIKNVLFQFIEHKEKRKYLMPAITKLLLLSKQQEGVFANSLK